jgi:predicted MFS family arabinose efflux permease
MDTRLLWLALGAFAGSVESSLVVIVMPDVAAEMGIGLGEAGWLIFVYSIAYGVGTPVLSTLLGRVDRRTVVAGAEMVFGIMALLFGLLPQFFMLLAARTILAFGAGTFTSTAQSTAVALAAPGRRGRAISTVLLGGSIAIAAGVPLAALATNLLGWRVAYIGLGVVGMLAAAIMWLRLPGDIHGDRRTLRERLSVLSVPGVPMTLLASGLYVFGTFTFFNYLPAVATGLMGLDRALMPVVMLMFGVGSLLGTQFSGRLCDRYGARPTALIIVGVGVVLLAGLPMLALLPEGLRGPAFFGYMGLYGIITWGLAPPQIHMLAALSPQSMQLSASLNLTCGNLGAAASALLGGVVLEHLGIAWLGPCGAIAVVAAMVAYWFAPQGQHTG